MRTKGTLLVAVATVVITAFVGAGASAGAGAGPKHKDKGLAGAWKVTVNRPAPLSPIASLIVFTKEGSVIETSDEPPVSRTTQIGSWERTGDHLYAATGVVFRFDASGNHVTTTKVNRNIRLSKDGQTFTQATRVTVSDLQGHVLSSFPGRQRASGCRSSTFRISRDTTTGSGGACITGHVVRRVAALLGPVPAACARVAGGAAATRGRAADLAKRKHGGSGRSPAPAAAVSNVATAR